MSNRQVVCRFSGLTVLRAVFFILLIVAIVVGFFPSSSYSDNVSTEETENQTPSGSGTIGSEDGKSNLSNGKQDSMLEVVQALNSSPLMWGLFICIFLLILSRASSHLLSQLSQYRMEMAKRVQEKSQLDFITDAGSRIPDTVSAEESLQSSRAMPTYTEEELISEAIASIRPQIAKMYQNIKKSRPGSSHDRSVLERVRGILTNNQRYSTHLLQQFDVLCEGIETSDLNGLRSQIRTMLKLFQLCHQGNDLALQAVVGTIDQPTVRLSEDREPRPSPQLSPNEGELVKSYNDAILGTEQDRKDFFSNFEFKKLNFSSKELRNRIAAGVAADKVEDIDFAETESVDLFQAVHTTAGWRLFPAFRTQADRVEYVCWVFDCPKKPERNEQRYFHIAKLIRPASLDELEGGRWRLRKNEMGQVQFKQPVDRVPGQDITGHKNQSNNQLGTQPQQLP